MYTTEPVDGSSGYWEILDPDGNQICDVFGEDNANALLSHLNR
jgi:hypothetical protein